MSAELLSQVLSRQSLETTPGQIPLDAAAWRYVALIVATFTIGLIVDQYGGLAGQLGVGAWSWLLALRLVHLAGPRWRRAFFACLVWATAGEIFLSLVWGLYTYRLGNIPFFIPPGHVFLFWLGVVFAPRVPDLFVRGVAVLAVVYAGYACYTGFDTISILLAGLFVLCWMQHEGRRLYSLMLLMSLVVELYGTWVGNWVWHANVPYFGLTSNNPPLAAGAFYCMLDVLIGLSTRSARAAVALPQDKALPHMVARQVREEG